MAWVDIAEFEAGDAFGFQSTNKFRGNEIYLEESAAEFIG